MDGIIEKDERGERRDNEEEKNVCNNSIVRRNRRNK